MNASVIRTVVHDSLKHEITQLPAILLLINAFVTQATAFCLRQSHDIRHDEINRTQLMAGCDYTRPRLGSLRQNWIMYLSEVSKM